mmetsp:Transcript_1785/g.5914  ORF Transcript_1785/g.5914 Transcript_1785/m.5914 type:complete len:306 (+) Transcript_1785:2098-3015(+)
MLLVPLVQLFLLGLELVPLLLVSGWQRLVIPRVSLDLLDRHPLACIDDENPIQQVLDLRRQLLHGLGHVRHIAPPLTHLLQPDLQVRLGCVRVRVLRMIKGERAEEHHQEEDPSCPHVHAPTVVALLLGGLVHQLGRHVHRRSYLCVHIRLLTPRLRKAKVANLNHRRRRVIQKRVIQLEVPVHDAVLVAVVHRRQKLLEEEPRLVLRQEKPVRLRLLPLVRHVCRQRPPLGILHHQTQMRRRQHRLVGPDDVLVPKSKLRLDQKLPLDVLQEHLGQRPTQKLDCHLLIRPLVHKRPRITGPALT